MANKLICPICGQIHDKTNSGIEGMKRCHEIVTNWCNESKKLKMEGLKEALNNKITQFNEYMTNWNKQ